MKKFMIILFLIVGVVKVCAQSFVTNEILQSVFEIRFGEASGSCFIVSIENNDYLITAKHLFPNINTKTTINAEVLNNTGWHYFTCKLLIHSNPNIDVAVLDLGTHDRKENLFDLNSKGIAISQDCYFLGFPFGLKMDDKDGKMNSGYPLPFVKKGIISSFYNSSNTGFQIFLDGHNNPGFSGGPVVITNTINASDDLHRMKIIGVVSAYINENKVTKTPVGDFTNSENSGIVICYAINSVFEILKLNK